MLPALLERALDRPARCRLAKLPGGISARTLIPRGNPFPPLSCRWREARLGVPPARRRVRDEAVAVDGPAWLHASRKGLDVAESMIVERDVAVPMRDGVVLRADVYRPDVDHPVPVIVSRTPY